MVTTLAPHCTLKFFFIQNKIVHLTELVVTRVTEISVFNFQRNGTDN